MGVCWYHYMRIQGPNPLESAPVDQPFGIVSLQPPKQKATCRALQLEDWAHLFCPFNCLSANAKREQPLLHTRQSWGIAEAGGVDVSYLLLNGKGLNFKGGFFLDLKGSTILHLWLIPPSQLAWRPRG